MQLTHKTLLITGIGSFLGLRAAERAIAQSIRVRGLAATSDQAQLAEQLGAQVWVGSITDPALVKQACVGADVVWHTDALNDFNAAADELYRINVKGTLNVAHEAHMTGVQAFVHLSSVIVYGVHFPDQVTEDNVISGDDNLLCQSRLVAEQQLLDTFRGLPDFSVTVIRAGDIYGPAAPSWVLQPLQLMQEDCFFLVNGGQGIINHVHVDNLIDSLFLAVENEAAYGEIFNITDGERTTWQEFYTWLAAIAGQPPPASMPALALKAALRLRGKSLGIATEAIDLLNRKHTYSIAKARQQLGYTPRVPLSQGMSQIATWLQDTSEISRSGVLPT